MRYSEGLTLSNVTKRFGSLEAVKSVSLEIEKGEFFSLLGPSGCGKTTLLRIIGGFESPDEGHVVIGGVDMTGVAPQKRPTAMVFQNYALFPNMTVGENVAYGLRIRKTAAGERQDRVEAALRRVNMDELRDKSVLELSGGQQQRVAVARALAVEPDILLFDEPLSNLDVALREQTRVELKSLHKQLRTTSVYVTHDQSEALVLSDRMGVMREGVLVEVGTPRKLYEQPGSAFVASFVGGWNIIRDPELARLLTGTDIDRDMALAIRPEALQLAGGDDGVETNIVARNYLGSRVELWLSFGDVRLRMFVDPGFESTSEMRVKAASFREVGD